MQSFDANDLAEIQRQLNAIREENKSLKAQIQDLKQNDVGLKEEELEEVFKALEAEGLGELKTEDQMKQELGNLLDQLEDMIHTMNFGTGMGLKVPEKLHEIRSSLTKPNPNE